MKLSPLITAQQIEKRLGELGHKIALETRGESLLVVSVLKGSFVFLADLVRRIEIPQRIDFLKVSSYGARTRGSGRLRFELDLALDPAGQHVLLVEDIVDSGGTLATVLDLLAARKPASLRTVALLCKSSVAPEVRGRIDYVGFEIGPKFVVGYGLDYAERFRERADICVLEGMEN